MSSSFAQWMKDAFYFPKISSGVLTFWLRNFLVFKNTIWISILWIFLEPVLYLYGIGYGLGYFVGEVEGVPYIRFYIPALMMVSSMFVSYFESTYGSYTKLTTQNTYHTVLLAPLTAVDIVFGEILWGATKGTFSGVAVSLVALSLGHLTWSSLLPLWLILFLCSWVFSALGVWMSSKAKNYDWFIYSQSGLMVPMSIFCGTFFPLSQLPDFLQMVAYLVPLTHVVEASRMVVNNHIAPTFYLNLAVIVAYAILISNWALASMERRIIR